MKTAAIRTAARIARFSIVSACRARDGRRIVPSWVERVTAHEPPAPRARRRGPRRARSSASRAYSEHVGANRQRARQERRDQPLVRPRDGDRARPRRAVTSARLESAASASRSSLGERRERRASARAGRPMMTSATRVRRARRASRGTPRAAAGAPGCAARHRGPGGSRRSPRGAARPSRARARSGRSIDSLAPLEERLELGARGQPFASRKPARSDGQPFPPLRAPPLEHLPPALGLHPLAEAMSLLPTAHIRLKRPLHEPCSPLEDRRADIV